MNLEQIKQNEKKVCLFQWAEVDGPWISNWCLIFLHSIIINKIKWMWNGFNLHPKFLANMWNPLWFSQHVVLKAIYAIRLVIWKRNQQEEPTSITILLSFTLFVYLSINFMILVTEKKEKNKYFFNCITWVVNWYKKLCHSKWIHLFFFI